jgi:hypothetical protein
VVLTALEALHSRLTVVDSGLRALAPKSPGRDADSLARLRQGLTAERAEIDAELQRRGNRKKRNERTVRFMWVEPPNDIKGYQGDVDRRVVERGEIEPNAASRFPGPLGKFRLMP